MAVFHFFTEVFPFNQEIWEVQDLKYVICPKCSYSQIKVPLRVFAQISWYHSHQCDYNIMHRYLEMFFGIKGREGDLVLLELVSPVETVCSEEL